jgi:hypothetical protein
MAKSLGPHGAAIAALAEKFVPEISELCLASWYSEHHIREYHPLHHPLHKASYATRWLTLDLVHFLMSTAIGGVMAEERIITGMDRATHSFLPHVLWRYLVGGATCSRADQVRRNSRHGSRRAVDRAVGIGAAVGIEVDGMLGLEELIQTATAASTV